ncbi:hypothetical protein Tco_1438246 [Tanacetum coccineum]
MSARVAEAAALSPSLFRKRYRSSYETSSPSSSLTLPIRKRYRGTSELVEDTEDESLDLDTEREGSEDEGLDSEEEGPGSEEEEDEAVHEGQQQAVPAEDTTVDEHLGLGYEALRHHELVVGEGEMPNPEDGRVYTNILTYVPPAAPVQILPSLEWSSSSLPVSPSSPAIPTLVASLVTTSANTIAVDEDEFLEVGAQLELHKSILLDHTQRLDALPPALFKGYDRDLKELYTRSGAVRDEIFSQWYRFRSLEREQKRATVTFSAIWRPIENHDLRRQIAEERRERLELTNYVARMERRHESRGEWQYVLLFELVYWYAGTLLLTHIRYDTSLTSVRFTILVRPLMHLFPTYVELEKYKMPCRIVALEERGVRCVANQAHVDSKIILQTVRAQSSRVPIPLSDDSIRAVRRYRSLTRHSKSSSSTGPHYGRGWEEEEDKAVHEGQQQAVPAEDTTVDEHLGLGYEALRHHKLVVGEGEMPSTFEVGHGSRFMPEHEGVERISAFRQPTLVTWVDHEDGRVYIDIPTYILQLSIYTCLDIAHLLDVVVLRYKFRSLEREQERVTVTFSAILRSVLALEAWAGQTDAQRAALWHVIYDTQRENHDLRMQISKERRERLELTYHVARMKRRHESRWE